MLQIKNISKKFVTGDLTQVALDKVSLNLRDNEFVAILGPSGSGKTTMLNIIGGLDRYDSGDLVINGISTKKYKNRDWDSYRNHTIGFVFQSYNLIPHQTILSNVELALTISGIKKSERKKRAIEALEKVGLGNQLHKKPNQLSGGQMQRVAIARALVNNPDILLADEPTGALDTKTSVQIMDILKDVAKEKLVVMVTHNPELAEEYATRIVHLKDGHIEGDTNPFKLKKEKEAKHKKMGKSSMSFITALTLSFNNLKTKKARTLLTSFAGSIGIIGIALIMALSNGVNGYIKSIEEETLSEYPLKISKSETDLTSIMAEKSGLGGSGKRKSEDVLENNTLSTILTKRTTNDLKSLKKYVESGKSNINQYTSSIEYSYNVTPNIFRLVGDDDYRQINPDKTLTSMSGSVSSIMSMVFSMSSSQFKAMPKEHNLFNEQYEVLAGKWPSNYKECVLVLSPDNTVSDVVLYTIGVKDIKELDEILKIYAEKGKTKIDVKENKYQYKDFLGIEFKILDPSSYYEYDKEHNAYIDKTDDHNYMLNKVKNGESLKIVGVVRAKETAAAAMLLPGIAYHHSLNTHAIEMAQNSEIVSKQKQNKDINVFTGEKFDESGKKIDIESLFSLDNDDFDISKFTSDIDTSSIKSKFNMTDALKNIDMEKATENIDLSSLAENIDMSTLQNNVPDFNFENIDFSSIIKEIDMSEVFKEVKMEDVLKEIDVNKLIDGIDFEKIINETDFSKILSEIDLSKIEIKVSEDNIKALFESLLTGYKAQLQENEEISSDGFFNFVKSEVGQEIIKTNIQNIVDTDNIKSQLEQNIKQIIIESINNNIKNKTNPIVEEISQKIIKNFSEQMSAKMTEVMQKYMQSLGENIVKKFSAELSSQIKTTMSSYMSQIMENISNQISEEMQTAMGQMMTKITSEIGATLSENIEKQFEEIMTSIMGGAADSLKEKMKSALSDGMNNENIKDILSSIINPSANSYESVLSKLNYAEFDDPYSILFYPKDFNSKDEVTKILDEYNDDMKKHGEEDKVIAYTDVVGTMMSSVTTIVNVISYILIAFVSVSLVVSSIMIGIITYISVLERTKEIGILRAIGASKRNISQVFNAETFIIGLCSGLLGIGISLLLLIPANAIIQSLTGLNNIRAFLPFTSALMLIMLSIVLTLMGGLIPSKKAAKKDPVTALRTD